MDPAERPADGGRLTHDIGTGEAMARERTLRLVDERGMALALPSRPALTVGRAAGNDVMVPDDTVSSRHAELRREGDGWVVIDRDSTNGTYVSASGRPADERRVTRCVLQAGATLRFGGVTYRVEDVPLYYGP
jgi:hypothetical protein